MSDKLTHKQELFCQEYIIDFNATQAYYRAGYKAKNDASANVQASKILRNGKVFKKIEQFKKEREERLKISAEWVLQEAIEIFKIAKGEKPHIASVLERSSWQDIKKAQKNIQVEIEKEIKKIKDKDFSLTWKDYISATGIEYRIRKAGDTVAVEYYKIGEWVQQKVYKTNIKEANNILNTIGKHTSIKAFEKEIDLGDNVVITIKPPKEFE
jgi:phage terminase small subunit